MSFLGDLTQVIERQIASVVNRFLHVPDSGYHYYWLLSFLFISTAYIYFSFGTEGIKRTREFFSQPRFHIELKKDIFFWSLRFLYKPVIFVLLGINLEKIEKSLFKWADEWGIGFSQPVIHLDPVLGSLIIGALIFIIGDFISYIEHFLQHRLKFLWYFHMTHHFAEVLNPLTKYRLHPVEYLYINLLPLFLKIPASIFIFKAFAIYGQSYVFSVIVFSNIILHRTLIHFRHSHIPIHYGFLSHILLSPVMHQVHHSRAKEHFNKNIGVIFSLWDGLFGTLFIPNKKENLNFGIRGYEKVILNRSYWFELKLPFILIVRDIRKFFKNRKNYKSKKTEPVKEVFGKGLFKASGFTLTEVLVSTMIFSLIALAASTIIINFATYNKNQRDIDTREGELESLVSMMEQISSRAVNVRFFNGDLNGSTGSSSGEGFVRTFNYTSDASMGARTSETLMFFAREVSRSRLSVNTLTSQFRPTGVFFVRKNESPSPAVRSSGKIVIDMGASNAAGVVRPDGVNDIVFENVSDVVLDQPQFSKSNILLSIRMRIVMIYPLLSAKTGLDCLGPTGDIASGAICNTAATKQFKTIEKSVVLRFPNNKRDTHFSGAEFETGLYMFPLVRGR